MRKLKYLWLILAILPLALLLVGYLFPNSFFNSQERVREFIEPFGPWAPVVFILLQIVQVVITPLSHYVVGLAGGYLFGPWYGALYNWIGRVIGATIAFILARKFGRKIIERFVKKENLKKYDRLFEKGSFFLFLMYFLPLFPDDELSYLAGFSSMKARIYFVAMMLGHIGGAASLAFLGSGVSYTDPAFIIMAVLTIVSAVIALIFWKKIKKATTTN
jgi:uncharacterized membrane protein YdjX (TVP38/TMEM64 family)